MKARLLTGAVVATAFLLGTAAVAYAEEEYGTKSCGIYIAYIHVRYQRAAYYEAPGDPSYEYHNWGDWNYHVGERNGGYSGFWYASSDFDLDTGNTWASCRPYGAPSP